ncbi:hypothetical protein KCU83_g418, partial [Aureobasidium melanogenum]
MKDVQTFARVLSFLIWPLPRLPNTSFLSFAYSFHQPLFTILETFWQSCFPPQAAQHQLGQTWCTREDSCHAKRSIEVRQ